MKSYSKRKGMPTRAQIRDHWFPEKFSAFGLTRGGDDELVSDECWACGNTQRVERCHIHSVDDGGVNTPDNLVLLCHACHVESENLQPDAFWIWVRNMRQEKWQLPSAHAADRMRRAGFTPARMQELIDQHGPEKAVAIMFSSIGVDKTYSDVLALYGKKEMSNA